MADAAIATTNVVTTATIIVIAPTKIAMTEAPTQGIGVAMVPLGVTLVGILSMVSTLTTKTTITPTPMPMLLPLTLKGLTPKKKVFVVRCII